MPNLKFLVSTVPKILDESQNSKSGTRNPHMTTFDVICIFLLPFISMPNSKFLTSTLPEVLGGPKTPKVGHVTPYNPL